MQLALRDANHGPFLSKVIAYGQAQGKLSASDLENIKSKAVLMSLKFADKFYNKYKMHLLEQAAHDIIGVASLGLAELSDQDLDRALALLQSPEGIVKPFQKGWSMLSQVSLVNPTRKSLYGDVEAQLRPVRGLIASAIIVEVAAPRTALDAEEDVGPVPADLDAEALAGVGVAVDLAA